MDVRGAKIIGLGSYVPERVMTNFDLEKMVDTTYEWIFSHTGMRERHIAAPEQATSDLAIEAGKAALADAGLAPEDLDLVIVATVTPDMFFPSVSSLVQGALGATHAGAFDILIGCTGFVYALSTASAFVQAGVANRVLVIAAETLSRIVNWEDRPPVCSSATVPVRLFSVPASPVRVCSPSGWTRSERRLRFWPSPAAAAR